MVSNLQQHLVASQKEIIKVDTGKDIKNEGSEMKLTLVLCNLALTCVQFLLV